MAKTQARTEESSNKSRCLSKELQSWIDFELSRGYQIVKTDQPGFVKLTRPAGKWNMDFDIPAQTTYIKDPATE